MSILGLIEEYREFVFNDWFPLLVDHARPIGASSQAVVMAAFLSLSTILQGEDTVRSAPHQTIDTERVKDHVELEALH